MQVIWGGTYGCVSFGRYNGCYALGKVPILYGVMEFPTLIGTDGGDGFLWWMLLGVLVPFLLGEGVDDSPHLFHNLKP